MTNAKKRDQIHAAGLVAQTKMHIGDLPEDIQTKIMQQFLMGLRARLDRYERFREAEWAWLTDNGTYGYHDDD